MKVVHASTSWNVFADSAHVLSSSLASSPGPLLRGEGPGTHCGRMLYLPSEHWEFGFYRKICSILLCVDIINSLFHTSSFAFVRICYAYRPPSSLKTIVPLISLASSLWRLLKARFRYKVVGSVELSHGE